MTDQIGVATITLWRTDELEAREDVVASEVPVALVFNGISHAVMMATPNDLEDFGLGFALSEGIIREPSHLYEVEVCPACHDGFEVHMKIASEDFWHLKDRRRSMMGRTGCGICGVESIDQAVRERPVLPVTHRFDWNGYENLCQSLESVQVLGKTTGAMHAAAWCDLNGDLLVGAEDVGRHVAMDKVLGKRACLADQGGVLMVSSRASYEMVQKAAMCGVQILCAISAPTALAIEVAQASNLTLVAFCRKGRANIYTHPERIVRRTSDS